MESDKQGKKKKKMSTIDLAELIKKLEIKDDDDVKVDVRVKRIKHYSNRHRILLVGEGDFSFAASLALAFGNASNLVATSRDSPDELHKRYANAKANLQVLKGTGCKIVHKVDALTMSRHRALKNKVFDKIVFNFPHDGLLWVYREHHAEQIELHQNLVLGFFKSAYKMMSKKGQVHVTHKTAHPFDRWNIEELADEAGLCLVSKVGFNLSDYPGYCNKKGEGHGANCDLSFPIGECSTFKFAKM